MEKNNGRKWTIAAFMFVCVAITGLTVAFANLSEQLDVSPEATVKGGNWEVKFANLVEKSKSEDVTVTTPVVTATTISNMKIGLRKPGDSVSYTFDVVNAGSIDAEIGSITIGSPICIPKATEEPAKTNDKTLCETYIRYSLVYSDEDDNEGRTPAQFDTLGKLDSGNNTRNMTLTITYDDSATSIPTNDVTVSGLDISITYVQD